MQLTVEQQALLNGEKGEALQKVMKTLVMYGETFGATHMVPVTSTYGHLVTSIGISVMKPVFSLMQQLIDGGALSSQAFSVDPRPLDPNVPQNALQKLVFQVMYSKQASYEEQLATLGLLNPSAFTCTCYMDEVGNIPNEGDVLSWAESSAVVYANSVLGARCNRNSGIIELFGSIVGCVPYFGLLTDEGRKAAWLIEVNTDTLPEAQVLGSAIGIRVMEDVPYIVGLDRFFPDGLTEQAKAYLKDLGAATASNGAVGLYHIEGLTPDAKREGRALLRPDAKRYTVDDAELARVRQSYPCIWKDPAASPKLCFVGCPHLSMAQLKDWTARLLQGLQAANRKKPLIPTVFTAAPAVRKAFEQTPEYAQLKAAGVVVSDICPLMYMNNPLCAKMPVVTNSNKLRTYTSARYHTDEEILKLLTKGGARA